MDFRDKEKDVFNLLTETISEGIVIVNSQQKMVTVNETLAQLFGYEKEELIDQPLRLLIPQKYHQAHTHSGHHRSPAPHLP